MVYSFAEYRRNNLAHFSDNMQYPVLSWPNIGIISGAGLFRAIWNQELEASSAEKRVCRTDDVGHYLLFLQHWQTVL